MHDLCWKVYDYAHSFVLRPSWHVNCTWIIKVVSSSVSDKDAGTAICAPPRPKTGNKNINMYKEPLSNSPTQQ